MTFVQCTDAHGLVHSDGYQASLFLLQKGHVEFCEP